jgi:hypothetical protein
MSFTYHILTYDWYIFNLSLSNSEWASGNKKDMFLGMPDLKTLRLPPDGRPVNWRGRKEIEMLVRLRTAYLALLRRSRVERELDEELRYHIDQQTEQNIRLGMNP